MKNNKNVIFRFLPRMAWLLGILCIMQGASAQMSGTVSIDAGGTASTTVFKNWYSFYRSLQGLSRNDGGPLMTAGVTGPVTVNVLSDVWEAATISFPAIGGMNSTNTITINGNSKALIYTGLYEAISFTGGDYFTIKNLTISDTNNTTSVIGIRFSNASDYNTIDGCTIEFTKSVTIPASATSAYIAFSPLNTALNSVSTVTPGSFCTIKNCLMRTTGTNAPGPYMGICMMGNATATTYQTVANNNTIDNNVISNFYYYGIYNSSINGIQITNNDISRSVATLNSPTSATMYGILSSNNYCTSRVVAINKNKIHDLPYSGAVASSTNPVTTFYGINMSTNVGNATYSIQVQGNEISKINIQSTGYGIIASSATYMSYTGNTVNNMKNYAAATLYGHYVASGTTITVTGNSFTDNVGANSVYGIYANALITSTVSNNLFDNVTAGSTCYGIMGGSSKTTVFSNNVYQNVTTTGTAISYGIQASSCTSVDFINNTFQNVSTVSGSNYGIQANSGITIKLYKNLAQNLTTSTGSIYGFQCQSCSTSTFAVNIGQNLANTSTGTIYGFDLLSGFKNMVDSNRVENCALKGTSGSIYCFYINSGSTTSFTVQMTITNNLVNNNISTITSTTSTSIYGFYVSFFQDVVMKNNRFTNNKLSSTTTGTMYAFYINGGTSSGPTTYHIFEDNLVQGNTSYTNYGFYLYNYNSAAPYNVYNNWQVNRNKMVGNFCYYNFYGLYMYYVANVIVTNNVIANNRQIGTYTTHYMYNYMYNTTPFNSAGLTWEVRNNTWQHDASGIAATSNYTYFYFYPYYIDDVRVTGNTVDYKGGVTHYVYMYNYGSTATAFSGIKEWDYNNWFIRGFTGTTYWYVNGTNYSDYATVKANGFLGPNDMFVNPEYRNLNGLDFHAKAFQMQNATKYRPTLTKDITGVLRSTGFHDIGAYEQSPMDLELVSTNFVVPDTVCSGYKVGPTYAIIKNKYAEDSATQFNVTYSINGGPKVTGLVTKKILPFDTAKIFFSKELQLNAVGPNNVVMTIERNDDTMNNQTFVFNTFVKPAPGGGKYVFSPKPTRTIYQSTKANDITVLNEPVVYNSAAPRAYDNSKYGISWTASAWATNMGGILRPTSELKYFKPTATSDIEIQYKTTDVSLEDSTIIIYLKYTDLNNGCDTILKRRVLIYPTIIPKFTYPAIVCDGDNVLFENQSKVRSGSMEFFWDFGTGNVKDNTETPEPYFTFPNSGTYKVKFTAKTLPYGFASYDSAYITVRPKPVTKMAYTNACEGSALTFSSAGTSPTAVINWDFGDNTSSTAPNPTHSYAKTGGYMVVFKTTENGCSEIINRRVYQFDKPKAKWSVLSGQCDNEFYTFSNTSTIANGSAGSYWDFNDGTISAENTPLHMFTSSGAKSVKLVAVSEFGCKDSLIKVVNVKESPKIAFSNTIPCSLTPTEFTNETPNVPGAIANYKWTFSDGGTSPLISPNYLFTSVGPKTVTLTMQLDNGCKASLSKDIIVGVQPKANFTAQNVCTGQPVVFENKTDWVQGDINYNWNFGDGSFTTDRAPRKEYDVQVTTTYTVTLVASISGGCSDQISRQITVNEGPKGCDFFAEPDYAQSYYGIKIQAVDKNGVPSNQAGVTYTWVIEGGGNKTGAVLQHDLKKDGQYEVTLIARVDATGCECSKTRTVVMNRTSVEELNNSGITVYPNPSNGNFQVALTENFGSRVHIELMSISGSVVRSYDMNNSGLLNIDGSTLADGMYVIRVSSGNNVATRRIAIRH